MNQLLEYLASHPYTGSKFGQPWINQPGNFVEWYWKQGRTYEESVHAGGWWVGSVMRLMETREVVGVKIHLEAFMSQPGEYDWAELET